MSSASQARLDGLKLLLSTSGESLTFLKATVTALVTRIAPPDLTSPGAVAFEERQMSDILILSSAVTSAPTAGESLEDATGYYHRIQSVTFDGLAYRMHCEVQQPTS
ncbi:MAG: hypothetical protein M1608_05220 [Candidatus Omnitrophica bacterium]|nr:hypothetical protein [Candidatus Omnitrophota bacterium]